MTAARSRQRKGLTIERARVSWLLALQAEGKSSRTIKSYETSVCQLEAFLVQRHLPTTAPALEHDHLAAFIADLQKHMAHSSVATRYDGLKAFFSWLENDKEIARTPLHGIKRPNIPIDYEPVIAIEIVRQILKTCDLKTFDGRRDDAIIRFLYDTGIRVGGLISMKLADINLQAGLGIYLKKGGGLDPVDFGVKTARSLDRYLRLRESHPRSDLPALWLGHKGVFTESGVAQMLTRRAEAVNYAGIHPHRFRHTFADVWLGAKKGGPDELVTLMGLTGPKQLQRYGGVNRLTRALRSHKRLSPGDDL